MSRSTADRIRDILNAIDEINRFVEGYDLPRFEADNRTFYAVIAMFTIIGEAARQIPEADRNRAPHIPWRDMIAMRNFVVHVYQAVSHRLLLKTIQNDLPPLQRQLADWLAQLEG